MNSGYLYICGTVLFTVYGQLILKWRLGFLGAMPAGGFEKVIYLLKILFDPFIFSGLFAAFIASLFWMAAMTKFDISYAYPFVTAGLTILTATAGIVLLGESLSPQKIAGVLTICIGVIVMSYSA